jgi:hypothetical protein
MKKEGSTTVGVGERVRSELRGEPGGVDDGDRVGELWGEPGGVDDGDRVGELWGEDMLA